MLLLAAVLCQRVLFVKTPVDTSLGVQESSPAAWKGENGLVEEVSMQNDLQMSMASSQPLLSMLRGPRAAW